MTVDAWKFSYLRILCYRYLCTVFLLISVWEWIVWKKVPMYRLQQRCSETVLIQSEIVTRYLSLEEWIGKGDRPSESTSCKLLTAIGRRSTRSHEKFTSTRVSECVQTYRQTCSQCTGTTPYWLNSTKC